MRGKARPDGNQRARLPEPLIGMPLTDEQRAELEALGPETVRAKLIQVGRDVARRLLTCNFHEG